MECRSRPTGFVEILFGLGEGERGGGGGWVGVTLAVKGLLFFCRVKEELKLEDSKQCPGKQCSLRRHR